MALKAPCSRTPNAKGGIPVRGPASRSARQPMGFCVGRAADLRPRTTALSLSPATTAAPAAAGAPPPPSFNWAQQWYPVLCAKNAPGPGPHAVQLLGRDLVVWKERATERWACVDDACPHRLAPLSEGRVEADGHLHCAYHGWAFQGDGACTRCPQAESAAGLKTILASPRSAVRSYPVTVAGSLVFVWPDAEPGAAARAAAAPPPVLPLEVLGAAESRGWFVRDLPYSVDFLHENVLDPAHLPVSHHGLAGILNRAKAKPVPMVPVDDEKAADQSLPPPPPAAPGTPTPTIDFRMASVLAPPTDTRTLSRLSWWAPSLVRYRYPSGSMTFSTNLYCVPTTPGRSRVFLLDAAYPTPNATDAPPAPFTPTALLRRALRLAFAARPAFLGHHAQGDIFDGDGLFLNAQMARLAAATTADGGGAGDWKRRYYLPATCDRAVAAFRNWLAGPGGGGPAWAPGTWAAGRLPTAESAAAVAAVPLPREAALDRARQHVKLCAVCQQAQKRLTAIRAAAVAVGCGVLLAAAFAAGRGALPPRAVQACAGLAVLASATFSLTSKWLRKFGFNDYVHAEKGAPTALPPEPVLGGASG